MNGKSGISAKAASHYVALPNIMTLMKLTLRALLFPVHAASVSLNVPWIDAA